MSVSADFVLLARRQRARRRWAVGLAVVAALAPALVLASGSHRTDPVSAATNGTVMPLQQFSNDGANGRLWNSYNQTMTAQGPTISGRPAPVFIGTTENVFARGDTGDLVQYSNDKANGRAWNTYDLTQASAGPQIVGDPAAVVTNASNVSVFARIASGHLVEFTNSGSGAHLWNATDLTTATGGTAILANPALVAVGSSLDVFAQAANGDLIEFSGTGSGTRSWLVTDVTQSSSGPALSGAPGAVLYGSSSLHVYGTSAAGHLTEFVNDGTGGRSWSAYDLTTIAAGPTGGGQPSAIVYGPTVHVYLDAAGHLTEFVNDAFGGRLWNSYDLTSISHGPAVTGDPSAAFYNRTVVDIFAQGPSGDLVSYVNDGFAGRLWNGYDLTQAATGPTIGADPAVLVNSGAVSVFSAGPLPPVVVQSIVNTAESQDQYNAAVTENPPASNCNLYSAYFGRGLSVGCAPGTSSEEWCSDFAQWVWVMAGVDTTGINGWAYTFVDWAQARTGAWKPGPSTNPQPGDAVVWGDTSTGYASHVGIVVAVDGGMIDVVAGNAGPSIDAAGNVDKVWDSGFFDPTTSMVAGYPIIGYASPVGWTGYSPAAQSHALAGNTLASLINSQDGGK